MADLDGDGTIDLVSGSYPGDVYWFRGSSKSAFAAPVKLTLADGQPVQAGKAAAVAVVDWDRDGRLDLVIGTIRGAVMLARNEGSMSAPLFAPPVALTVDGVAIVVESDAGPAFADWDGDGRADLIVGAGDGSVQWFRNVGAPSRPQYERAIELIPHAARAGGDPKRAVRPALRAKVCAYDWDGDGKLDLLVGDARIRLAPELKSAASGSQGAGEPMRDAPGELPLGVDGDLPPEAEVHGNVWVYLRAR